MSDDSKTTQRYDKCQEPLALSHGARQAFADRQTKLIQQEGWPGRAWYSDEDFCRAYNTAAGLCDIIGHLVPQTYGEAIVIYPWLKCEPHEWDNRTTAENAAWLCRSVTSIAT